MPRHQRRRVDWTTTTTTMCCRTTVKSGRNLSAKRERPAGSFLFLLFFSLLSTFVCLGRTNSKNIFKVYLFDRIKKNVSSDVALLQLMSFEQFVENFRDDHFVRVRREKRKNENVINGNVIEEETKTRLVFARTANEQIQMVNDEHVSTVLKKNSINETNRRAESDDEQRDEPNPKEKIKFLDENIDH